MTPLSTEQALLNVERSDAAALDLLDKTAEVLGISLSSWHNIFLNSSPEVPKAKSFAPREEWALRWWLKHLPELSQTRDDKVQSSFVLSEKSWTLALYLIQTIPWETTVRLLQGSGFFAKLPALLLAVSAADDIAPVSIPVHPTWESNHDHSVDHPHKRRRLSPSGDTELPSSSLGEQTRSWTSLYFIVCQFIVRLADGEHSQPLSETSLLEATSTALPFTLLAAAEVVELSLRLLLRLLETDSTDVPRHALINAIPKVLEIWRISLNAADAEAEQESAQIYHQHGGFVSLTLLQWLKSNDVQSNSSNEAMKVLEQQISLHTVLPLRAKLNAQKVTDWTSNRSALGWSNIKSSVGLVIDYLHQPLENAITHLDVYRQDDSEMVALILDIAIRSVPSSNIRKRQREQMWLEKLILGLAYHACRTLPKMEPTMQGILEKVDIIEDDRLTLALLPLSCLLEVAIQHHITISLPLLSYLTSVVLESSRTDPDWMMLGKLVMLDCDVLIPNSGIQNATGCLDELCGMLSRVGPVWEQTYTIIRNDIVMPLIDGFGRARDVAGFLRIWRKGMEESMHQSGLTTEPCGDVLASAVWEDDDILKRATEALKTHATPFLTRIALTETLQTLRSLQERVGSTLDVFAQLAVLERFILARPEDFLHQQTLIEELHEALVAALELQSTHQSQRWRLWSLLRCAAVHLPNPAKDHKLLQAGSKLKLVPLTMVEQLVTINNLYSRVSNLKEAIECFHLLVTSAVQEDAKVVLLTEVSSLIALAVADNDRLEHDLPPEAEEFWNGRTRALLSKSQVVDACTAILLQKPESVTTIRTLLGGLVGQLIRRTNLLRSSPRGLNNEYAKLVQVILTSETLLRDHDLYQELLEVALHNAMLFGGCELTEILLRKVSFQALTRKQLDSFCDDLIAKITDWKEGDNVKNFTSAFALLEQIVRGTPVSVGSPKHWDTFLNLSELVDGKPLQPGDPEITEALNSMMRIFQALWDRTIALGESFKARTMLSNVVAWCQKQLVIHQRPGLMLSAQIVAGELIENFREDQDNLFTLKASMAEIRRQFLHTILQQVKEILKDGTFGRTNMLLTCRNVQLLMKDRLKVLESDDAQSVVQYLHRTVAFQKKAMLENGPNANLLHAMGAASLQLQTLTRPDNPVSIRVQLDAILSKAVSQAEFEATQLPTASAIIMRARIATQLTEHIPRESYAEILELLHQEDMKPSSGGTRVDMVAALLNNIDPAIVYEQPNLAVCMQDYATLRQTLKSDNLQDFCMGLEMCRTILTRLSGIVNQAAIDKLLAALAVLTSSAAQKVHLVTSELTTAAFDRICNIIAVLLGRFRSRLQSRYHLLLPILQNLLHCLYCPMSMAGATRPNQTHQQLEFIRNLPIWMSSSTSQLPPASTATYARLLTSICNPTTSAIVVTKRHHAATRLNDETKKARSIAGQYMQYLVVDYTRCTLEGQIGPESKQKLMPRMYAVLDCMSAELMRAMNAAMDGSSRAVFKNLYDDWIKFGRWTSD